MTGDTWHNNHICVQRVFTQFILAVPEYGSVAEWYVDKLTLISGRCPSALDRLEIPHYFSSHSGGPAVH
jgi:hypothetical protein